MRVVLQRVTRASVRIGGTVVASIGTGFVALVGATHDDGVGDARSLASKVATLRLFEDTRGRMNLGLDDVGGDVLVVPQFTLYGDARKGRRPSWAAAAAPDLARELVEAFAVSLEEAGVTRVERGAFREHMEVEFVNDGPVTVILDSPP